jgi:hypothetical protein
MNFKELNLTPGDRIIVPKSQLRVIEHHATYLGQNFQGEHFIVDNIIGEGVRLITADLFFKDVIEITRIERFTGSNYNRKILVIKALNSVGKPYDLINYNCEHFANELSTGNPFSKQLQNAILGFTVVFILGILLSD